MKITVRKTKKGLSFRFAAGMDDQEGVDLKNAVLAGVEKGINVTAVIDKLKEDGYEVTSFTQRGERYLKAEFAKEAAE